MEHQQQLHVAAGSNKQIQQNKRYNKVTYIEPGFIRTQNRITSIAVSPNRLIIGNSAGLISIVDKLKASNNLCTWREPNSHIEGIMYDYEGRVVYGT